MSPLRERVAAGGGAGPDIGRTVAEVAAPTYALSQQSGHNIDVSNRSALGNRFALTILVSGATR